MIRATTPTHTFTFSQNINDIYEKILITYSQNGEIILEKEKSDLTIATTTATYTFTQEETLLFSADYSVNIQVRAKTLDGQVLASTIYTVGVNDVLNDEVL